MIGNPFFNMRRSRVRAWSVRGALPEG